MSAAPNMKITTMHQKPTIETIKDAAKRIKPYIHRTPVHISRLLNEIVGALTCPGIFKPT
jgi:threonine dehydratase